MQRLSQQSGFTLLETLIAFVVMAFSVAAIYQTSISISGNLARQIQLYEMTEFARSKLDEHIALKTTQDISGTYKSAWDWQIDVTEHADIDTDYLARTHIIARTTVTVFPAGTTTPRVTLTIDDLRRRR